MQKEYSSKYLENEMARKKQVQKTTNKAKKYNKENKRL